MSASPFIRKIRNSSHFNLFAGIGVAVAVAVVGYTLFFARAAGPFAQANTGTATVSGNASLVTDPTSSQGRVLQFGFNQPPVSTGSAPSTPPAQICGNASVLNAGPTSAPSGAVTVPAGDNSGVDLTKASTTYWFAAGTHTIGTGEFANINPGNNSTFIGAPGAILDGQGKNHSAFDGQSTGVTIEYLTIKNFGQGSSSTTPSGDDNNQGVVNHDSGHGWTVKYNTVIYNAGAGVFGGTGDTIAYNCLTQNGQYGFSFYEDNGVSNVVVDHNEISSNDTYDWEAKIDGCGCTGGGKFWATKGAAFTNNYVHDNASVGMWADTNNTGFDVEGNYFANNAGEAIIYEISYNALFRDNTFIGNAIKSGQADTGFPHSALYISESGSDSRVAGAYGTSTQVTGNVFTNNWGGVILWENADRYCSSVANTSSGDCTLVNPSVANITTCKSSTNIKVAPYINDCRWKTQNVQVSGNTFNMTPSAVSSKCTSGTDCGYVGVFSQYGSIAPFQGTGVEYNITFHQNNLFSNNTYSGTWNFMAHEQNNTVSWSAWKSSPYSQDAGSTLNGKQ